MTVDQEKRIISNEIAKLEAKYRFLERCYYNASNEFTARSYKLELDSINSEIMSLYNRKDELCDNQ